MVKLIRKSCCCESNIIVNQQEDCFETDVVSGVLLMQYLQLILSIPLVSPFGLSWRCKA